MRYILIALCCFLTQLSAESITVEIPEDFETKSGSPDVGGFLQKKLDRTYRGLGLVADVETGEVTVKNIPKGRVAEVARFMDKTIHDDSISLDNKEGMWFPQSTILYPAQVANPRQISFSLGYRARSKITGKDAAAIYFGDYFPFYRWRELWKTDDEMQIGLEGGVFGIFNQDSMEHRMVNSDYYVAIPLSYREGDTAYRLRGYHISSHLGDEFLLNNGHEFFMKEKKKKWRRKNKSFEALDFFVTQDIKDFRLYAGAGVIFHSDSEMHLKPLYFEYGLEYRPKCLQRFFNELIGQPFFATHIRNAQDLGYKFDTTVMIGYEWMHSTGIGKKMRLTLEYHAGFSPEGQFTRYRVHYGQLTVGYGF